MTPESIKMSNLILDAEMQCNKRGHSMDWRRYSNYQADAMCRKCDRIVDINRTRVRFSLHNYMAGAALNINCTKKER